MSRDRQCGDKRRHLSRRWAKAALKRAAQHYGEPVSAWCVYQCRHCSCFHIGHRADQRRAA